MNAWIKETAQKYAVALLTALTFSLIGLGREVYNSWVTKSEYIETAQQIHTQDSIRAVEYMIANDKKVMRLEITQDMQAGQISRLQKSNERIKSKLNIR